MFRDYGISLKEEKDTLPPREDVVEFDVRTNTKDLENNKKLQGRSRELKDRVKEMVPDYWDLFCEYGSCCTIRGNSFHIDIGKHPPI